MPRARVTKYYTQKDENGDFRDKVYFGTYGNFVTVRRPGSTENYEDLQTCLDNFEQKIRAGVVWNVFSD